MQVTEEVIRHFPDLVAHVRIPRAVRLAEAPSHGQPISVYDPTSRAALAYRELADELSSRLASRIPIALGGGGAEGPPPAPAPGPTGSPGPAPPHAPRSPPGTPRAPPR